MKNEILNSSKRKLNLMILFVFGMFFFNATIAQTQQKFTTPGTFTVPAGVTSLKVECWGAGGGGSTITDNGVRGGGGGGGAYAISEIAVTPGATYSVTVGVGGAANTSGGASFFDSNLVLAAGGSGATANSTVSGSGGLTTACVGTLSFSGASGGTGGTNSGYGGGAAGSTGTTTTITGKALNGGNGGAIVSGSNNGISGSIYGGGGSGASTNSDVDRTGGAGANGLVVVSWATDNCVYGENTSTGITITPNMNFVSPTATLVSSTLSSHQYFLVNAVKGITYNIYTSGTLSQAVKMAVYEEGNSSGSVIASSFSNTGNTNTNPNNVFLSFTSPISGQVRVLLNALVDCSLTTVSGISAYVTAIAGSNTQDTQTTAGTNSWIGHIYDGSAFDNYLGYYPQTETFREQFSSTGTWPAIGSDDVSNFNFYSNGSIRGSVKVATFSVKYRMNSTRKGLYTATMTSDDGQRMYVDGNLIYNNWTDHSPIVKSKVLFSLTGTSALELDYYEKTGQNVVGFDTLQQVMANKLAVDTIQSICMGDVGSIISGDVLGTLPTGITLSGTGYQWTYSTTPAGTRTNITGATAVTFTPNTTQAPFNVAGTYYLFRNVILSTTNNVSPSPYVATNESNAAVVTVNPLLPASVTIVASNNMLCNVTEPVTFTATPINGGTAPVYQWFVNGITAGTNSATFVYSPANNDLVSCVLTSNATPCLTGSPATSNTLKMLIIDSATPVSVSIVASGNPSCSGTNVSFTATPVNGGLTPQYQWFVNGMSVSTSGAVYTYQPVNLDVVSCILTTSVVGCVSGSPAISNNISMSVNPSNTITLSSAVGTNAQGVCNNVTITNITYTTTGATGATFSGLPTGVTGAWTTNKVTISGKPSVAGVYNYTVSLTGGNTCTTSATGTITVYALPSVPTTTGVTVTCIGGTATLTAHGSSSTDKYKWYTAATGGTLLKTSTSNTDSTYVPSGIASTTNYYVAIVNANGCEGSRTAVTATFGVTTSTESQTIAGTDTWIGYAYDGTALTNYYGHFTETEAFDEQFVGSTTCFGITSGVESRTIYTETFSVRYRMNSTRRGLYAVTMGSDDGSRLYVDGNLIYNNWVDQAYTVRANVLMNLTGSSALIYDFYENGGSNRVTFTPITLIIANSLSSNTTQNLCIGAVGTAISGDVYGTLPTGITLSGTGYQWYYSTTVSGTQTAISGATSATFTPNTTLAPFNTAGTYYLYRYAVVTSTNNVSPTSYTATNVSNAATIVVSSCNNYWLGSTDTNWANTANWTAGFVPATGADIEFATVTNYGTAAQNNLNLDQDRSIAKLTNMSTKRLVIPAAKSLTVTGTITTDNNPDRIYIQANDTTANGTFIFSGTAPYASVEMCSKAYYNLAAASGNQYHWQYFGIPTDSITASPTFDGAYIRKWYEPGVSKSTHWVQLGNSSSILPFWGYEICQQNPTKYVFQGKLLNRDFNSQQLSYTYYADGNSLNALYPGQHVMANPYTAAIDITKLTFGSEMEKSVYLYTTGSLSDWSALGSSSTGSSSGQYQVSTIYTAGVNGIPATIPSMQGFLVKAMSQSSSATLGITYSSVKTKNTEIQRAKSAATSKIYTAIDVYSEHYNDRLWIFTDSLCTSGFDNGWDGLKMQGSTYAPQIYAAGADGSNYQIAGVSTMNNTDIGLVAGIDQSYTLKFTHQNAADRYQKIYLYDKSLKVMTDVTESGSSYAFDLNQSENNKTRFKILTLKNAVSDESTLKTIYVFSSEKTVFIQNSSMFNGELTIYDAAGHFMQKKPFAENSITAITTGLPSGIYVIKAHTEQQEQIIKIVLI